MFISLPHSLKQLATAAEASATDCALASPWHGPDHWRTVALKAVSMFQAGEHQANLSVVFAFAALHDTQRLNDYEDPEHGDRAAALLDRMPLDFLSDEERELLRRALVGHTTHRRSEDPTLALCWDADRLTLPRVGITPSVEFLSTATARAEHGALAQAETTDLPWEQIAQIYGTADYFGSSAEELDPELADCVCESEAGMAMIGHPLVHDLYMPGTARMYNMRLRAKREALERAEAEQDWHRYVFLHERPYRVEAFVQIAHEIEAPEEWWDLMWTVWTDSENIRQFIDLWREIFSDAPTAPMMRDPDDQRVFAELPQEVTIYRGTNAPDSMGSGMSWTTSRERAEWFARRLLRNDRRAYVLTGTVCKEDVIGYTNARGEQEIVTLPEAVTLVERSNYEEVA